MNNKERYELFSKELNMLDYGKIKIRFCERLDEKSSIWNFSKHAHDYFELIYFITGKANITINSEIVNTSLFNVIIYPPGAMHREVLNMSYHQEIICIGIEFSNQKNMDDSFHVTDKTGDINWLFEHLYVEIKSINKKSCDLVKSYIKSLFCLIQRELNEPNNKSNSIVMTAERYIQNHFKEDITLELLAKTAYVSKSYLSRVFKNENGISPINYLVCYRLEVAKRLLKFSDESISQITVRTGFNDSKYFSRSFKQYTGISPNQFRKKIE